MPVKDLRRQGRWMVVLAFLATLQGTPAQAEGLATRADAVNVFYDPDLAAGQSLLSFYQSRKFIYIYREIIPLEAANSTYFAILGSGGGYPDFYGGIQLLYDGRKAAIFSVWDVGSDGACSSCQPGTAPEEKQASVWAKGPRTTTRMFGGEGTGMNSMIYDFEWKFGQKVAMLASVEPAGVGSLISAAFKNGDDPWEFATSFYVPARYDMGMPGNYSFVEDYASPGPSNESQPRSYLVGPSLGEDKDGNRYYFTNVWVSANNSTGTGIPNRHSVAIEGSWLRVRTGIPASPDSRINYRLQIPKPTTFPDISAAKALLESKVVGKSTRYQEELERIEQEAKARALAEANAKAEAEARALIDAAKKAAAAKAKRTTITCVKGKAVKKVTGLRPKCPAGFKKR